MAKTMASLQAFPSSLLPRAWSRALIRLTCGPLHHSPSLSNACHKGYAFFSFHHSQQQGQVLPTVYLCKSFNCSRNFRLRYVFHSVITFQAVAAAGSDMVGFSLLIHSKRFFGSFSNSAVGRI